MVKQKPAATFTNHHKQATHRPPPTERPGKQGLEDYFPLKVGLFSGSMWIYQRVTSHHDIGIMTDYLLYQIASET